MYFACFVSVYAVFANLSLCRQMCYTFVILDEIVWPSVKIQKYSSFNHFNYYFIIFACFRYMQSFLELLEYENKSPEDPHVLDE